MKRLVVTAAGLALVCAVGIAPASAQAVKSHSSGFFVGLGLEGNGIVTNPSGSSSINESGSGAGVELGYGFSPRWALYGDASGANINADGGGTYTLTHVDVGARVHFRTGPNVVVPFLQFGLAGRDERQDVDGHTVSANGAGVSFGGGLNAHFNPAFAFTGSVTWVVGNFSNYRVDNVSFDGSSVNATSARLHLGVVWFPGA